MKRHAKVFTAITAIIVLLPLLVFAALNQDQALQRVGQELLPKGPDAVILKVWGPIPAGTRIESGQGLVLTAPAEGFAFYIDITPTANLFHPVRYAFVDAQTGAVTSASAMTSPANEGQYRYIPTAIGNRLLSTPNRRSTQNLSFPPYNPQLRGEPWAVLMNGGYNQWNNHVRYWNDLSNIYMALTEAYGYADDHIIVLCSDGLDPAPDQSNGLNSDPDLDGDGDDDIMYSCTLADVDFVFGQLAATLSPDDKLFVFTTDHGGSLGGWNTVEYLWNEEEMTDAHFAELLAALPAGMEVTSTLEPCNSGGFLDNIIVPPGPCIGSSACAYNESSWAMPPDYVYDTYVFHWTAAVKGEDAYGNPVDADANNDGYVSMVEAYDYAVANDISPESPQYDDYEDGIGNGVNMFLSTITVVSPNGGEEWFVNSTHSIRWTSDAVIGNVDVLIQRSPDEVWTPLFTDIPNDGSESWVVTGPGSFHCRVMVRSHLAPFIHDESDGDFTIRYLPNFAVTYPNGGETWYITQKYRITWIGTGIVTQFNVKLNRNYPDETTWETLAVGVPGPFDWLATGPASNTCRIRVEETANPMCYDESDANFSIVAPTITVTAPNGGEVWYIGDLKGVWWSAPNVGGAIDVALSRGPFIQPLFSNIANDGYEPWVVTGPPSETCLMQVSSHQDPSISDVSNAYFSVRSHFRVTSPNGGENWYVGSTHNLTWSSVAYLGNVDILINRDYPNSTGWVPLFTNIANDGTEPWMVTFPVTSTARIKVQSSTNPNMYDISDANFTISCPTITVLSPNGGEGWYQGDQVEINWSSVGLTGNVNVDLLMDYGYATQWVLGLKHDIANSGSLKWTVNSPASIAVRARVESHDYWEQVTDISDDNFKIYGGDRTMTSGPGSVAVQAVPDQFFLAQNTPNPFNPVTTISYGLPTDEKVDLEVYNLSGRLVATLAQGTRSAGYYQVNFDGSSLTSGVYIYRLQAGSFTATGKMVLLK